MPICLEGVVEREIRRRLLGAVFDAWARRLRVRGRQLAFAKYQWYLLRALLRFWAGTWPDS